MTDVAQPHHARPWYKRPLVGIGFIILAAFMVVGVVKPAVASATIRYSDFLDQLDASNIASITFAGTQIDGHFKQPVTKKNVNSGAPLTAFRSQAPTFGDPTLIPELRKERVAIGVKSPQWLGTGTAAVFGIIGAFILAKPMLLIIAAAFIAGLVKMLRGGKVDFRSILSTMPMFGSGAAGDGKQQHPAEIHRGVDN